MITGNAGQGKTTVAKNIAFALRSFGFDVLLVDSDLKTPKLGYHVGMPLVEKTIQDVLIGVRPVGDAVYVRPSGVKLLLSSLNSDVKAHPSSLLPDLQKLADVIVVDVPTYDNVWYATGHKTVLVTQPDLPSVFDVQKLSKSVNYFGVIVNRWHDDGIDLSAGNIGELISLPILGVIPAEAHMREALRHGYSVIEFHPELRASIELKSIAAKLMNLEYKSPLRASSFLAKLGLLP